MMKSTAKKLDRGLIVLIICTVGGCQSPPSRMQPSFPQATHIATSPVVLSGFESSQVSDLPAEKLSIDSLVAVGLANNPSIAEAQQKIEAIRYRIPQALSLPDPMINTTTFAAPIQTAAGEQVFSLGVSQKIVNSQRRTTQAAILNDELLAAEANLRQVELEIADNIRSASYQVLMIRQSIEILEQNQEILEQLASIIVTNYEVKRSISQTDVINIQIEQSDLENQMIVLRQKEQSSLARLNRLLRQPLTTGIEILDKLQDPKSNQSDIDSLIQFAVEMRPDLQSQLAMINRDRKKIHLAGLERKPDFTVGANWIATNAQGLSPVANGDDAFTLGLAFNLPVYRSRIQAAICEARANLHASDSRYQSLVDNAAEEVFAQIVTLDSIRDTWQLLEDDIIPKAERTLDIALDEYSVGKAEYVQMIEIWRGILKYKVAAINLRAQYSQSVSSLNRTLGVLHPLPQE